jgi:hypothetical protein
MQTLREWVQAAAADLSPGENTELIGSKEPKQAAISALSVPDSDVSRTADLPEEAHGQERDSAVADREFLAEAKRSLRHDPFDPAVFNRRRPAGRGEE